MRTIRIIFLSGLMGSLMAVTAGHSLRTDPVPPAENSLLPVSKKVPVPFNASINAMITGMAGVFPVFDVTVNGSGNATHLGMIGFDVDETIVFNLDMSGEADQRITLTAANGDQLHVHARSSLTPVSADPLILDEAGTGTITGGTGRFEDASGTLTLKASVNTVTRKAQITLNGIIIY